MQINTALRSYQIDHSAALATIHPFVQPINERFYGGELPQPAIGLVRMRPGTLGQYWRQDGLTLLYRINLNSLHANRPLADLIVTLAHEMGHLQQHLSGKPGRGNYHNRQFRLKMEQIGIPCDERGRTLAVQEPFISFLQDLGVEGQFLPFKEEERGGEKGTSRPSLIAWSCECPYRIYASVRVEVRATCTRCGQAFASALFVPKEERNDYGG